MSDLVQPEPFDLDAVVREERGDSFWFTFGGEKFILPAEADVVAMAALSKGHLYEGLAMLFGPDQWEAIQANASVLTTARLEALLDAYGKHLGIAVGESPASTPSSRSKGRR